MYEDFFWSTGIQAVRIGESDKDAAKFNTTMSSGVFDANNGLYTIFDTGSSEIYISALYYEDFINMFFSVHNVDKRDFEARNKTVSSTCKGVESW